jgi:hypothetical protein
MLTERIDLPSPQQIRETAAQAVAAEHERLRNKVIKEIQESAAAGRDDAVVYFNIPASVREELTAAGYQVKPFNSEYEWGYIVSWYSQEQIEKGRRKWRIFNGFT